MSLTPKTPADTYKDLTYIDNNNSGVDSTLRAVKTGNGSSTSVMVSDRALRIDASTDNTTAFIVRDADGNTKFNIDTTNDQVKSLGTHVNTQYATFGIGASNAENYTNNTHYCIPFGGVAYGSPSIQDNITFGTGTDPATSFTTADGSATDASLLVPVMWYLPDAISIDSVTALQGLEQAGTNTTRCHLFSYTFTSGSTSALTSGTLLAHSDDLSNAGSEQA